MILFLLSVIALHTWRGYFTFVRASVCFKHVGPSYCGISGGEVGIVQKWNFWPARSRGDLGWEEGMDGRRCHARVRVAPLHVRERVCVYSWRFAQMWSYSFHFSLKGVEILVKEQFYLYYPLPYPLNMTNDNPFAIIASHRRLCHRIASSPYCVRSLSLFDYRFPCLA